MKVKELKELLKNISEDAEVYIDKETVSYVGEWEGAVKETVCAARRYVHPKMLRTARRPCKETEGSRESLVIYVKQQN